MLEPLLQRRTQRRQVSDFDSAAGGQSIADFRPAEVKDQVIGAQTGDVAVGIKTFQRVIKIIRQEDRFDIALLQHGVGPFRRLHFLFGRVVDRFPIRGVQTIAIKVEEASADRDQPTVLRGVLQRSKATDQTANLLTGR